MDQPLAAGSPAEGSQLRTAPRSRPASPVNQLGWHQFDFQRQLGRGSSGTAELVLRKSDGMLLVMKVIQVSDEDGVQDDQSVNNEVNILTKLKHPHIIGYYGSFMQNSWLHILMDYADGGTLEDVIHEAQKQGTRFSKEEIMTWTCQLVLALKYTHSQCILHRDLKQANIFLVGRRMVKLGDFGLARTLSSETQLAETACGTPYYLSPELCLGQKYNQKSDCWALGCVVYEMLTLKRPFHGKNLHAVVMKICHEECAALPEEWGRPLTSLVYSMLQKEPASRPSMAEASELPFIKDFTTNTLPGMLQHEQANRKHLRPKHRRTNSDVSRGSPTCSQSGISFERPPNVTGPLTPLTPVSKPPRQLGNTPHSADSLSGSPAASPVPEKIRSMFETMKRDLSSQNNTPVNTPVSSGKTLEPLKAPTPRGLMSPVQIHPFSQAQSPVPSMNEIDKSRAVVCPAGVNDDQFSQSELYGILQEASLGLEGLDMFVSPRMRSESVGIDPRLIASLPAIPSSISNAIGDEKLKLEALAHAARRQVSIKDRGSLLQTYKQCCCGSDLVTWMVRYFQIEDRSRVLPVCDELLNRQVISHSNGTSNSLLDSADEFYQFQEDVTEPCLNLKRIWDMMPSRPAHDVAHTLRAHLQKIYEHFVSPDRRYVDYDGMKTSDDFLELEMSLTELQSVDLSTLSFREKLAFWINLYNIMCIHMIIVNGPPDSAFKRWQMYSSFKYNIDSEVYSIADLKHGILRGNQKAPYSMFRQFGDGDPRRVHALPIFDPRVHFALVEGSITSPRLFVYKDTEIDKELTNSAKVFCEDLVIFNIDMQQVILPEVLKEFYEDFQCSEKDLVKKHLSTYCEGQQAEQCSSLFVEEGKSFTIEYHSQDWELNTWTK